MGLKSGRSFETPRIFKSRNEQRSSLLVILYPTEDLCCPCHMRELAAFETKKTNTGCGRSSATTLGNTKEEKIYYQSRGCGTILESSFCLLLHRTEI